MNETTPSDALTMLEQTLKANEGAVEDTDQETADKMNSLVEFFTQQGERNDHKMRALAQELNAYFASRDFLRGKLVAQYIDQSNSYRTNSTNLFKKYDVVHLDIANGVKADHMSTLDRFFSHTPTGKLSALEVRYKGSLAGRNNEVVVFQKKFAGKYILNFTTSDIVHRVAMEVLERWQKELEAMGLLIDENIDAETILEEVNKNIAEIPHAK